MRIKQEMLRMNSTRFLKSRLRTQFLILVLALGATAASNARPIRLNFVDASLATGYRNCTYQDLGNQTSKFSVTYDLRDVSQIAEVMKAVPSLIYVWTRGLMIYTYVSAEGGLESGSSSVANSVSMNGTRYSSVSLYSGSNFIYSGQSSRGSWTNYSAHSARLEVIIPNGYLHGRPAIGIRTALVSGTHLWRDSNIISIDAADTSGNCRIINPTKPPPSDAQITMTAPDWKLGELSPGESFHNDKEQLCFSYDGQKWTGLRYAINATNQNGLSGDGSYQLQHLTSPSDTVPYRVLLQNTTTSTEVALPNTRNVVSTLGNGGRECFNPKFTVNTPKAAKEGDYGDVLTFTVVSQP